MTRKPDTPAQLRKQLAAAVDLREKQLKKIKRLQAENRRLKARIEKATEAR
jgi:cell shape-determining protein MreC